MKLKIKFPILNFIILAITYVLFYSYLKYFKDNDETKSIISAIPSEYGVDFINFMNIFKMQEVYFTTMFILILCTIYLTLTYLAKRFELKYLSITMISLSFISGSFIAYEKYIEDKYINETTPVISKLLDNEILYNGNKFENAFFRNSKFYLSEYKTKPTIENKIKYSMSLYFIPDNLHFIKTIDESNVEKYTDIMKLNFRTQLNYQYFINVSILYLFLISFINLFVFFRILKNNRLPQNYPIDK